MVYVALLRGINVGGANKIGIKELAAAFEDAGMASVRTFINSGNVIFTTDAPDRAALTRLLERAIATRFGLQIGVILRDADQMAELVRAIPAEWGNNESEKTDVLFLWPEVDRPSVVDELSFHADFEDVLYAAGAVVRRVDRTNAARSGLLKIIGTPLYRQMTARNSNTTRKLLELMTTR